MRVSEQLDLGYLLGRIQNGLLPTVGLSVLITAIWAIFDGPGLILLSYLSC